MLENSRKRIERCLALENILRKSLKKFQQILSKSRSNVQPSTCARQNSTVACYREG